MSFNFAPSAWIPNWSEDGTHITVPIASFSELTAAEAHATTGDVRKVWFALLEQMRTKWAATPTADRPGRVTINSNATVNSDTGVVTRSYTISFQLIPSGLDVAAES